MWPIGWVFKSHYLYDSLLNSPCQYFFATAANRYLCLRAAELTFIWTSRTIAISNSSASWRKKDILSTIWSRVAAQTIWYYFHVMVLLRSRGFETWYVFLLKSVNGIFQQSDTISILGFIIFTFFLFFFFYFTHFHSWFDSSLIQHHNTSTSSHVPSSCSYTISFSGTGSSRTFDH